MAGFIEKLSYARSLLITAPLIFLYTAIMGTISVTSSLIDSRGRIQHGCSRLWARMILWTSRVRVRVSGAENVKPGRPYVLCANHQSHMDIPILLAGLPFQFRFAAKKVRQRGGCGNIVRTVEKKSSQPFESAGPDRCIHTPSNVFPADA